MSIASLISSLTGLDDETVQTQILPSLAAYQTRDAVRNHLKTLLGDGTQAAFAIQSYIDSQPRFAPKPIPTLPASPPAPKKRGQSVKAALKPAAPRQVADWSAEFGSAGTVYQKHGNDDGLIWGGGGGGGSGSASSSQAPSRPSSGRNTPLPLSGAAVIKPAHHSKKHGGGGGGGLTSDLLGGKAGASSASGRKEKPRPPQSAEVQRLETLIGDVEAAGEDGTELRKRALKKNKGGCFCMGRIHSLSTYTPQCATCFLPLCSLQLPYLPCPSCGSSLLNPSTKARLLVTLRSDLAAQVVREEREKARLEDEAREHAWREAGGGAFPTLGGGAVPKPAADASRRVMSLNPKTGKIQMTAFVKRESPASSRPASPVEDVDDGGGGRIAAPRTAYPTRAERDDRLRTVLAERAAQGRAFLDVGGLQLRYREKQVVVPAHEAGVDGEDGKKKRRRGKGKGAKGKDDGGQAAEATTVDAEQQASGSGAGGQVKAESGAGKGKGREGLPHISQLSLEPTPPAPRPSAPAPSTAAAASSTYSPAHPPPSRLLVPGTKVLVIQKQDQPSGRQTAGEVQELLTRGDHPRGCKVRCKGGMVGRVVGLQQ